MITRFWRWWRDRCDRHRSLGFLLRRRDDHLIRDIGLDRAALRRVIDRGEP